MRILTVRQPWASALIYPATDPRDGRVLLKDVENRLRNVGGGYRGPVAIHASKAYDAAAFHVEGAGPLAEWWNWYDGPLLDDARGHIIGVVDLAEAHRADWCWDGPGVHCSPWAQPDVWHLVFANPRPLAEPIPYTGALGLRTLDDDTTARILEAIA